MYSVAVAWNILYIPSRVHLVVVLFKSTASLLILCLDDLSTVGSGVLKSSSVIVLLSISPFCSVNNGFIFRYCDALFFH